MKRLDLPALPSPLLPPLPTFEAYRDARWEQEHSFDADLRSPADAEGRTKVWIYVGPALVPTPERALYREWAQMMTVQVGARATTRFDLWLHLFAPIDDGETA